MKILIKRLNKNVELPSIIKKGEWIDLRASKTVEMNAPKCNGKYEVEFHSEIIPLGIAMKLPDGFEAIIAPRSSSFKKMGILETNGIGIVDNSYCGETDQWGMPVIALRETKIEQGDRICQFRIQLSQKANIWQKIKWLFSNKIEIKEVCCLNGVNRGGFGSTGNK